MKINTFEIYGVLGFWGYKDRLYGNMGLVQAGMVKPEDNLIFQENGKQSFDILAQQINGYAKEKENYIKRQYSKRTVKLTTHLLTAMVKNKAFNSLLSFGDKL